MSVPLTEPKAERNQDRLRALLASRATLTERPGTSPGTAVAGPVPLNAAQAGLWFEARYQPDSPAYNVPVLLRMRGPLDRAALLGAVRDLAERHQVLRGTVDDEGEHPVLVIRPADDVPVEEVDLTGRFTGSADEELTRRAASEVSRPFALDTQCPLRVVCYVLGEQDHALLLVVHHIATDAWSNALLVEDLAALYAARRGLAGYPPPAPQYAHAVPAPAELTAAQLDWWEERLRGSSGALDLPTDRPRTAAVATAGETVPFALSAGLTDALRTLATSSGCTPFMVLVAAWQALLARITGSTDVTVGVPEGGRRSVNSEKMLGFFVNTVVLRTDLDGDPSGRELLERVRVSTLDALSHADAPFHGVVDRLRAYRQGGGPLFDTMINLYRRPGTSGLFPGVVTEFAEISTGSVKVDLSLHFFEEEGKPLAGVLEFRSALFDRATAARLVTWYERLLTGLVADPGRPVGAVPLDDPLSGVLRGPVRDYPLDRSLPALVEDQAESAPDAVAVTAPEGTLSYAELDRRANRVAHRLLADGVREEQAVAVLADRSLELIVALLGVLKAGAAFVPLEPSYPDDRLTHTVEAAGARVVLAQRAFAPRVGAERVIVLDDIMTDPELPALRPDTVVHPDRLAYMIFTSGSTGTPKGVCVTHRNIVHYVQAALERIDGSGQSFALLSTAAADLGFISLFGSLISGGQLHLVERETATDPEGLAQYFVTHQVDVVKMVPSHLELLAAHGDLAAVLPRRTLILAGEACPWDLADRIVAARPGLTVHNHYGPTETTVSVLGCTLDEARRPTGERSAVVPLGRPFPNAVCYVVDRAGRVLPRTVAGELLIAGPGVARGYLNNTEATARAYLPDPVTGTERCYRTGDRVRVNAEGLIEFLGRFDDQVKVRGYRVELGEVMAACRALPAVRDAVVLAVGQAHQRRLVAWLVPNGSEPLDPGAVRTALRAALPDHMVPSAFVTMAEIPLTPNGKTDRKALPEPGTEQRGDQELPSTDTQRRIAEAWQTVLELDDPAIGIDEDFFALGGDSFRALRASRAIDPALRVIDLFTRPTIRELAAFLTEDGEADNRLLQQLARPREGRSARLTVLCVPYAGGSSASFQPLAAELAGRFDDAEVFAVELPGHDPARPEEDMLEIDELVRRCHEELIERTKGPVLVYGHCVGTAPALALAQRLESGGSELVGVVLGGSFPNARLPGRLSSVIDKWFPSDRWTSDRRYREGLQALGGQLENEEADATVMRGIRHDVRQSVNWFSAQMSAQGRGRLRAPVLCVVGERDRTTELSSERYQEWTAFADRVELASIAHAGHYFVKHQAAPLADLIRDRLTSWQQGPAPRPAPTAGGPRPELRRDLRQLRTFYGLALSQMISLTGSGLTTFGLGVYVYQRTHQVGYYSLITMLALLPAVIAAPLGGAIADRHDRRKVMLSCNAVYGVALAMLITLAATSRLGVWEVAVFVGSTSTATAFHRPAYLASVAQLVPKPYLAQANGVAQLGAAVSTLVAPVAGGALITVTGLTGIIYLDLAALLIGAVVLLSVRFPDRLFRKQRETFGAALLGGWRFIIRRKEMVAMVLFFVVVNYITATTIVLTGPLVLSVSTPTALGLVTGAGGLGAIIGGLAMVLWGGTRRRANGMIGLTIGMALATVVIGVRPYPALMGAGLFLWWACNAMLNAHWLAIIQAKVGLELQGRVLATNQMLATAMMPVGFLLTPLLYNRVFGPQLTEGHPFAGFLAPLLGGSGTDRGMGLLLVTSGLALAVWGVLGLRYRPLRYMEDRLPDVTVGVHTADDLDAVQAELDSALPLSRADANGASR